ncbi:MAG: hypothetical protein AB4368_05070 [Xenococcaceae cyanobacterium]
MSETLAVVKWLVNVLCQQLLNPVWQLGDFFVEEAIAHLAH